jgi:hypothetical protein
MSSREQRLMVYKLGLMGLAVLLAGLVLCGQALAFETRLVAEPSFGSFAQAVGLTVDQSTGNVFAVDSGLNGSLNEVLVFGPQGEAPLGGGPASLTGALTPGGAFVFKEEPSGPAAAAGSVYVADVANNRIVKLTLNAAHEYEYVCEITAFGTAGAACTSSGTSGGSSFGEPLGVALDSSGDLYVSDYSSEAIYEFSPAGEQVAAFSDALLGHPQYLAVAADGTIYAQNYRNAGLIEFKRSSPTGAVEGAPVQLLPEASEVSGLAYDRATGRVIADLGTRIEELDSSGHVLATYGAGTLSGAGAIAVDEASDRVYVIDAGQIAVFGPPVSLARVSTGAASSLTPTSATLNGNVNPEGTSVRSCIFEYGPETSYGSSAPCVPAVSAGAPLTGNALVAVSAQLSGLTPGSTLHYRLLVTGENGSSAGEDHTVAIPLVPPVLTDAEPSASNIARTRATLTGTIDPEGAQTTYYFVYGTSTAYGSLTPVAQLTAGGSSDVAAGPVVVDELLPNTTYHYALVATNEPDSTNGTVTGPDYTFTTAPATPPVASTGGASAIGPSGATLSGAVETAGLQSSYGFQLAGAAGGYGPELPVGSGTLATALTLSVEDLQPGTTYRFRAYAVSQDGTTYGADETFTTPGVANPIAAPVAPALIAVPAVAFPAEAGVSVTPPGVKALTNAQKRAKALLACHAKRGKKRAACERAARKRYAPAKQRKGR